MNTLRIAGLTSRPLSAWIGVTALLVLWAAGCGQRPAQPAAGDRLSQLQLVGLTGAAQDVILEELDGQVVLLNFWGTWCPPCQRELPHIAAIEAKYRDRTDFRLLAVSCAVDPRNEDEPQELEALRRTTAQFLGSQGLDLPTYADPGAITRQAVNEAVGFEGYPTTLLIDRQGVIRKRWVGYRPGVEAEMEQAIEELLSAG